MPAIILKKSVLLNHQPHFYKPLQTNKAGTIEYKGHEFLELHFRTPTTCDSCNKPMWHMLHPPPAMECRRTLSAFLGHRLLLYCDIHIRYVTSRCCKTHLFICSYRKRIQIFSPLVHYVCDVLNILKGIMCSTFKPFLQPCHTYTVKKVFLKKHLFSWAYLLSQLINIICLIAFCLFINKLFWILFSSLRNCSIQWSLKI